MKMEGPGLANCENTAEKCTKVVASVMCMWRQ